LLFLGYNVSGDVCDGVKMTECEMCGLHSRRLMKCKIEGAMLNVCQECGELGERVIEPRPERFVRRQPVEIKPYVGRESGEEAQLEPEYAERIREGLQKRNLTAEMFAKLVQVRVPYFKRIVRGEAKPDKEASRKIEFGLRIRIIQQTEAQKQAQMQREKRSDKHGDRRKEESEPKPKKFEPLTIGDIVEIKKSKEK